MRILLAAVGAALAVALLYAAATRPAVSRLASARPATTAFIEAYREEQGRMGKPARLEWRWVPDDSISSNLKRAVITSEDIGFFSHHGFDLGEMRYAFTQALRARAAPRGASTITQQLAKNLWLSPSRNPLRKVREAILTRELEAALSKKRILELYLNVAEFGRGIYGADAAARHYFGKSAASLSEHEAAMLAAALPRPRSWNPESPSISYARQVVVIESRMARATFLRRRLGEAPISVDSVATAAADSGLVEFLESDTFIRPDPLAGDSTRR